MRGSGDQKLAIKEWFSRIPKEEWQRHGWPILAGYVLVYISISFLSFVFTVSELQFLDFLVHPLTAFFFSVFITVVMQASFITEFAVLFAAASLISLPVGIALVLGGNVGTCITNTVVSFINFSEKGQFKKAFSASVVHDLFNILMVLVILPAELSTQFFSKQMLSLAHWLGANQTEPAGNLLPVPAALNDFFTHSPFLKTFSYSVLTLIAVLATVAGILLIVVNLKKLFLERMGTTLKERVFTSKLKSVGCGIGFTFLVQSSSISTSLVVPLVGNGTIKLTRAFYYLIGCNVGTAIVTVVMTLPIIWNNHAYGTAVALGHLIFNFYGVLLMLAIPAIATMLCLFASRIAAYIENFSRLKLGLILASLYYILPLVLFLGSLWLL
jgi:sodium-dependent phosphate cotransporter